jgi:Spy/CpxP family protein refolding chaperone
MLSKLPLIAILAILPAAAPVQQAAATASFCERLAPRLGMKPNQKHGGKHLRHWHETETAPL